jgi:glycosyltransferase involved in cell wall biosynthesis
MSLTHWVEVMRVLIDGFNLGLKEGTGIATYTRNAVAAVGSAGHHVGVLYDKAPQGSFYLSNPERRATSVAQQILLGNAGAFSGSKLRYATMAIANLMMPALGRPKQHALKPEVVLAGQDKILPGTDLLSSPGVFEAAFAKHGAFATGYVVSCPDGYDLFHVTSPVPIRARNAANVMTVHDVIPLTHPASTSIDLARFHHLVGLGMRCADAVVTVSEHSKAEILKVFPEVAADKVHVTYQHVDVAEVAASITAQELRSFLRARHLQEGGYLLCIGAVEPKKNFTRAIKGYLGSGVSMPLVMIGKDGWLCDDVERALDQFVMTDIEDVIAAQGWPHVRRFKYVAFRELLSLIKGAKALLFPSLAEGFGLPVLEAMSLGCPVITSNASCLPEIAGDAALLVNPYDVADISRAIAAVCSSDTLGQELAERGCRQAAGFSLQAHAARLMRAYEYALAKRGR